MFYKKLIQCKSFGFDISKRNFSIKAKSVFPTYSGTQKIKRFYNKVYVKEHPD